MVKDIMNNKSNSGVMMAAAAEEEDGYVGPKGGTQQGLKKGPWTAAEDAILMEYVKKHGEGNWNSVQKNSGLMRCGKSCRLRWANHLRPNLKKGSFTPEEERLIIHLHSKIGNKWARMASQLPGRTDNEIKNFWNTRMKRRQRGGLPLYPNEFQESTTAFHLHHHHRRRHQKIENPDFNPNSQSPSLSTLLSSSSHHQKIANPNYNPSLSSVFDPKNFSPSVDTFQNHLTSSFYPNQTQFKFYGDVNSNDGSLAMALYPRPPSSTSIFNQNLAGQAVPTSPSQPPQSLHDYNCPEIDGKVSFTSLIMGGHVGPVGMVLSLNSELPSEKTPPRPTTPLSIASNTSGGGGGGGGGACACDVDSSNQNTSNEHETVQSVLEGDENSGLLDALLHQSDHMARKERSNHENLPVSTEYDHKGKGVVNDDLIEEEKEEEEASKNVELSQRNSCEASGENQCDEMSFSQSSIGYGGTNPSEEHVEEMNSMDDDLLSLLNFPSSTPLPLPDWYQQTRNASNGSLLIGHDNGWLNVQQDASMAEPTTTTNATPNLECALGSYYWNNMAGICENILAKTCLFFKETR